MRVLEDELVNHLGNDLDRLEGRVMGATLQKLKAYAANPAGKCCAFIEGTGFSVIDYLFLAHQQGSQSITTLSAEVGTKLWHIFHLYNLPMIQLRERHSYSKEDLKLLRAGVEAGDSLSGLAGKLGRSDAAIQKKLIRLSVQDPENFPRKDVSRYTAEYFANVNKDPTLVERMKQKVLQYLLKKSDATLADLHEAGLGGHLHFGYGGQINAARRALGLEERKGGGQLKLTKAKREERLLAYMRAHPNATRAELVGYDVKVVYGNIHAARIAAGLVPKGYIHVTEAARLLGVSRVRVSQLREKGEFASLNVGANYYVSLLSIHDRLPRAEGGNGGTGAAYSAT